MDLIFSSLCCVQFVLFAKRNSEKSLRETDQGAWRGDLWRGLGISKMRRLSIIKRRRKLSTVLSGSEPEGWGQASSRCNRPRLEGSS
eukprot:1159302-Pelagomonas_calceolata.AAC.1